MSENKVQLLKDGGVFKYTEGRMKNGAHSSLYGSVIVDRVSSDKKFAVVLFHESVHLKSYKALQVERTGEGEREMASYRSGFSVMTRDGKRKYFDDIEEALTVMVEQMFCDKIKNHEFFKEDSENIEIRSTEEEQDLNKLVDLLWERNQGDYNSREEILDVFFEAKINGHLVKVGKLIDNTFGKGSFRKIGEDGMGDFLEKF